MAGIDVNRTSTGVLSLPSEVSREVVAEMGLPVELAGRIQGDDREAMLEDAKVFAAIAKTSEPSRPAPIGAVGNGNNAPLSTSELFSNAIKGVL